MVEFVFNILVYIINTIIWLFAAALNIIFSLLPNSPFTNIATYDLIISKYLSNLAWILPIKQIISILGLWLGCMLIYYIYSVVMRWIKLID